MTKYVIEQNQVDTICNTLIELPMKYQPLIISLIDFIRKLQPLKEEAKDVEAPPAESN